MVGHGCQPQGKHVYKYGTIKGLIVAGKYYHDTDGVHSLRCTQPARNPTNHCAAGLGSEVQGTLELSIRRLDWVAPSAG